MRQVNVFLFSELSESAQEKAVNDYRDRMNNYDIMDYEQEIEKTAEKIERILYDKVEIGEKRGRAFAFIYNNYIEPNLTFKKYWNHEYDKHRVSNCIREFACPFTGMCYDYILMDAWEEWKTEYKEYLGTEYEPNVDRFVELLREHKEKELEQEYEYVTGFDYISETLDANGYEFLEDGTAYKEGNK